MHDTRLGFAFVLVPLVLALPGSAQRPGDSRNVTSMNPAYAVERIRPAALNFPAGGMDWMSDGRLVVASWKDPYGVFIVGKGITGATPKSAPVTPFATGLSEVLGVKVVNDSIYVLEKDQLTLLLDSDGDGTADEYRAIAYDWTKSVNEKEYAVGLAYDGTWFYALLGDPTIGSGTAIDPQPAGRQNGAIRIRRSDGRTEPFTGGMRVPGGIDMAFGNVWATETQGGYRVSHPLYIPKAGRFYGRPVNPPALFQPAAASTAGVNPSPYSSAAQMAEVASPFAVNIPFKNIGKAGGGPLGLLRTPGNPVGLLSGPYAGQILIPEADKEPHGEMARVFIERMPDGEYQGAAFHFASNTAFEGAAVFNLKPGPDGHLYAIGNGSGGAGWGRLTAIGLDRMKLTGAVPFDILAVRNLGADAFEVQFTKPLAASLGADVARHLTAQKWWDKLSDSYGCCRADITPLTVASAAVQSDRSRVRVGITGLTRLWTYHLRWSDAIRSEQGDSLWGAEAWYTLNAFGPAVPVGIRAAAPSGGSRPFASLREAGGLRVSGGFASGVPFEARLMDLEGREIARRGASGAEAIRFTRAETPAGMFILRISSGRDSWSVLERP